MSYFIFPCRVVLQLLRSPSSVHLRRKHVVQTELPGKHIHHDLDSVELIPPFRGFFPFQMPAAIGLRRFNSTATSIKDIYYALVCGMLMEETPWFSRMCLRPGWTSPLAVRAGLA